ncbi:hypothetical protein EYF80_051783 [Liparis tanakae]|uniref:Uncharacterized protein n=1 Tax=Liparis tanakae TaxID=230148 RepID=A0A4Z2FA70_9TELE|nr:hypothetical protein EYF80_051783 [Liparis tanakae]
MSGCSAQNASPMMSQRWACTLLRLRVTATSASSPPGSVVRLVEISSRWTRGERNVGRATEDIKEMSVVPFRWPGASVL